MIDAKSAVLAHARNTISRSRARPMGPIPRNYIRSGGNPSGLKPIVDEMIEKLEDYSAEAIVAPRGAAILNTIDELLGEAHSVIVPTGLPGDYKKVAARGGRTVVEDSREEAIATLDLNEINTIPAYSHVGISISGTIALDGGPDQGRRAISLAPGKHVMVLERETIIPTVPQAVDVLEEHPTHPMTWIVGDLATSDIGLVRVNGVHGLHNLRVVIAH